MSWDGMYEKHPCKRCGTELGRVPAELYASTYNGLCYPCTSAPAYEVEFHADGAISWSHPPLEPSHRRDRRFFIGYAGCEKCEGRGRIVRYGERPFRRWAEQCRECYDKYYNHPARVSIANKQEELKNLVTRLWDEAVREKYGIKGEVTIAKLDKMGIDTYQVYDDLGHVQGHLLQAYHFGQHLLWALSDMVKAGEFDV